MQPCDPRIEDLYCSFSKINTKKDTAFTKEEFVTKLEYELLNNPRVKSNKTVSSAIDYLVISEKLPYETIAGFIHNGLVEEFKYNKPIKITGLRPGEKMLESLISETQSMRLIKEIDEYMYIKPPYKNLLIKDNIMNYNSKINPLSKEELFNYLNTYNLL